MSDNFVSTNDYIGYEYEHEYVQGLLRSLNAAAISESANDLCPSILRKLVKYYSPTSKTEPAIALDVDGTITDYPDFFRSLSHSWLGQVHVITARGLSPEARKNTIEELAKLGVYYDELHLVRKVEDKPPLMLELGISVIFDDYDEAFQDLPIEYLALKVRNDGNYESRKWYYDHRTGIKIGP